MPNRHNMKIEKLSISKPPCNLAAYNERRVPVAPRGSRNIYSKRASQISI